MPKNDVHICLREATRTWHRQVDDAYSRFDLGTEEGYVRFLCAHRMAASCYQQWLEYFAVRFCRQGAPDYCAMLSRDLDFVQPGLPSMVTPLAAWNSRILSTAFLAGLGYTVCGSRLGMAAIHHDWVQTPLGKSLGNEARFLADREGLVLWKKFIRWSETAQLSPQDLHDASEASAETFALFDAAAHTAAAMPVSFSQPESFHVS